MLHFLSELITKLIFILENVFPQDVFSAIEECDIFFPIIKKLFLILATLPISIASAERSFSTLRRLYLFFYKVCFANCFIFNLHDADLHEALNFYNIFTKVLLIM